MSAGSAATSGQVRSANLARIVTGPPDVHPRVDGRARRELARVEQPLRVGALRSLDRERDVAVDVPLVRRVHAHPDRLHAGDPREHLPLRPVPGHDHGPRPAGEELQVQVHRALVDRADGVRVVEDHLARGLHVEPGRSAAGHAGRSRRDGCRTCRRAGPSRRSRRAQRAPSRPPRRPPSAPGRAWRKRRSPAGCRTADPGRPTRAGSAPARVRRRRPAAAGGRAAPSPAARPPARRRSRTSRRRPSSRAPGRSAPRSPRARRSPRRCGRRARGPRPRP